MDKFMQDYASISVAENPNMDILFKRKNEIGRLKQLIVEAIGKAVILQLIDELEKLECEYAVLENLMRVKD